MRHTRAGIRRLARAASACCAALTMCTFAVESRGQYVPLALDHPGTRTDLTNQGYLQFQSNPIVSPRYGDEYTGWIDVRHPARSEGLANDTNFGFDMSDHQVSVRTTTLTDSANKTAAPLIGRDFNYAGRIYAQAGLSVIQSEHRNYKSGDAVAGGNPVTFTFPTDPNSPNFDRDIGRSANNLTGGPTSKTIDVYYARELDDDNTSVFRGYAYFSGATAFTNWNPFTVVGTTGDDTAVPDTFAHEIGHFLLNGPSVDNPYAGGTEHSATKTNYMARGAIRWYPGQAQGDITPPNDPPSAITESLAVVGPTMKLNADGTPKIGGIDQMTGGTSAQSQVKRIFDGTNNDTTAKYLKLGRNAGAGNRVDFDFTADAGRADGQVAPVDPNNLEGIDKADNFPGGTGERMYFGIPTNPVEPSDQTGKVKTGLGSFNNAVGNYGGTSFIYADIFSLSTLYSDSDTDGNTRDTRDGSLDYKVWFSDGAGGESLGVPVYVFTDGWSTTTQVDDYVARWVPSDPNFIAKGLFISALDGTIGGSTYDRMAQIDAVIVGVPEPSGVALVAIGLTTVAAARRQRRLQ